MNGALWKRARYMYTGAQNARENQLSQRVSLLGKPFTCPNPIEMHMYSENQVER